MLHVVVLDFRQPATIRKDGDTTQGRGFHQNIWPGIRRCSGNNLELSEQRPQFTCLLKTHLFTLGWSRTVLPAPLTHYLLINYGAVIQIDDWLIDRLIDWLRRMGKYRVKIVYFLIPVKLRALVDQLILVNLSSSAYVATSDVLLTGVA